MWSFWKKEKEREKEQVEQVEQVKQVKQPKWYRFVKSSNHNEIVANVISGGCYRLKNKSNVASLALTYIQVEGEDGRLSSFINIECFEELTPEHTQILEMFHNIK